MPRTGVEPVRPIKLGTSTSSLRVYHSATWAGVVVTTEKTIHHSGGRRLSVCRGTDTNGLGERIACHYDRTAFPVGYRTRRCTH